MRRFTVILAGLASTLVGLGLILPALAKVRDYGAMPGGVVGFYTLGVSLALVGASAVLYAITRRSA